jgi:hypothetical protein
MQWFLWGYNAYGKAVGFLQNRKRRLLSGSPNKYVYFRLLCA